MTISDVNIALRGKLHRSCAKTSAPAASLGFPAGLKAYRVYQALSGMTAEERRRAGITRADLPRIAARSARLIA